MRAIIFGGAGYIGTKLAEHLLSKPETTEVVICDIQRSSLEANSRIKYFECDVRKPINIDTNQADWIFNFAAVHREPGHQDHEYFETNLLGAENVCNFAESIDCKNIYFTSSISVYGPTSGPTDEHSQICPITPYGGSKYPAELIHRIWQNRRPTERRLVIVRPGVVYGPQDPGNIGRMLNAIKRGYFAFPGSTSVMKSYAYVYGLLDSIDFVAARQDPIIVYNYVETPTESLGDVAKAMKIATGSKAPILSIPTSLLLPMAKMVQAVLGDKNPIHPLRVIKAGRPTHIIPGWLINQGFTFNYPLEKSLKHWKAAHPKDF
jgi:nucleoside-diphosphate-sugar epimerase